MSALFNTFTQAELTPAMYPEDARRLTIRLAANQVLGRATTLAEVTADSASEVQTVTPSGTISGGTWFLIVNKAQTAPLAHNANAAAVKAAIEAALTAVYGLSAGTVNVTGGPLTSGAFTITFAGECANQPQDLIQLVNNLTGSTPAIAAARTTAGVAKGTFMAYNDALSDGRQIAKGLLPINVATDPSGRITGGVLATGGESGATSLTTSMFIKGWFRTEELIGLDANAVTDLGRLVRGSVSTGLLQLN